MDLLDIEGEEQPSEELPLREYSGRVSDREGSVMVMVSMDDLERGGQDGAEGASKHHSDISDPSLPPLPAFPPG